MHCKTMKEFDNMKKDVTKNGKNCVKGNCPKCKTKMFKFVK